MNEMQELFDTHYPSLPISIIGINEHGQDPEGANEWFSSEVDLPWLQDSQDEPRHVWNDLWDVTYRDVQVVGRDGEITQIYNVTANDLGVVGNFNTLRDYFVDAAATAPATVWQSPIEPLDVNEDGFVAPIDALTAINAMNAGASGALPANPNPGSFMVDVNGDNILSPLDPLVIVNHLNSVNTPQAALSSSATVVADDASDAGNVTDFVFSEYDQDDDEE